jgi:hypothetical protein
MKNRTTGLLGTMAMVFAFCNLPLLEAKADERSAAVQSGIEVGVDVALVRPLSIVSCLIGAILYLPAVGLSFADGQSSLDEAKEIFIIFPYEYAFERSLGSF